MRMEKVHDFDDLELVESVVEKSVETFREGDFSLHEIQFAHEIVHAGIGDKVWIFLDDEELEVLATVRHIVNDDSDIYFVFMTEDADEEEVFDVIEQDEFQLVAFGHTPEKLDLFSEVNQRPFPNEPFTEVPNFDVVK